MSQNYPNILRLTIHDILNPIFLYVSLRISQSTHLHILTRKTMCFIRKLFSNLVFGDDFVFNGIIWMYHQFFHVLVEKWHQNLLWRTRERLSRSPQRSKKCAYFPILSAVWTRKFSSHRINYFKHSNTKSFKFYCWMIQVLNWAKKYTETLSSLGYTEKLWEL